MSSDRGSHLHNGWVLLPTNIKYIVGLLVTVWINGRARRRLA